jgi:succinate dehydrogenase/fumarate reductase-like Fe-S protein
MVIMKDPKTEFLGAVRLPESLRTLLDERCKKQKRTKSDIVRSALCHWLGADLETCMDHIHLTQEEENNNGQKEE